MKDNGITFGELRELLLGLGFLEKAEPTRTTYTYPDTGTFLLFRPYDAKECVSDRDMLVARRQLLENSLIDPAALDRLLDKASA